MNIKKQLIRTLRDEENSLKNKLAEAVTEIEIEEIENWLEEIKVRVNNILFGNIN